MIDQLANHVLPAMTVQAVAYIRTPALANAAAVMTEKGAEILVTDPASRVPAKLRLINPQTGQPAVLTSNQMHLLLVKRSAQPVKEHPPQKVGVVNHAPRNVNLVK
ncbi:MAG: hypothetical protein RL038_990, partial [Actinomycetota bacterium]